MQQEFEAYLKCGRLEEGFLRVRCERCHAEKLVAFSCKKRGFCPSCGARARHSTHAHTAFTASSSASRNRSSDPPDLLDRLAKLTEHAAHGLMIIGAIA